MPQHSTPDSAGFSSAYAAARQAAGLFRRTDRARIVVSGRDRGSYLHGLLTNDIAALTAGQGCYAAYLTAQGRMITDLYVYELGDIMLLAVPREVKETLLARLDQFIFTEDVQLGDVTGTFESVCVIGPKAARIVAATIGGEEPGYAGMAVHGNVRAEFRGAPVIVLRVDDSGAAGFELLIAAERCDEFEAALRAAGAAPLDGETVEALRIESGVPKFHVDMDEDTIPLEAGIEGRAISMTKGCYVGQEVIVRVLHRGHGRVARRLVGLAIDGTAVPRARDKVLAGDREVGFVTSAVQSPSLGHPIALGYVHRDFVEPGTALTIGGVAAVVSALPFVGR